MKKKHAGRTVKRLTLNPKPQGMPIISAKYDMKHINSLQFDMEQDVVIEDISLYKTICVISSLIGTMTAYTSISHMQFRRMALIDLETIESRVWEDDSMFKPFLERFKTVWNDGIQEYFDAQIEKAFYIQFDKMLYQDNFPFDQIERDLAEFGITLSQKVRYQ